MHIKLFNIINKISIFQHHYAEENISYNIKTQKKIITILPPNFQIFTVPMDQWVYLIDVIYYNYAVRTYNE